MRWLALISLLVVSTLADAQDYYQQQLYTVEIPLSRAEAWALWTSEEGVTSFFSPKANIGDGVGEPYEVLIDTSAEKGKQGNEGCVITQYQQYEKLGFQWVAPPKFADERATKMEVFLLFEAPYENWTKVTLAHIGWQEGGQWPEVFAYFEKAWPWVMDQFEKAAYAKALSPFQFVVGTWKEKGSNTFEVWQQEDKQMSGQAFKVTGTDTTQLEQFTLSVSPTALFFTPFTLEPEEEEPFVVATTQEDGFTLLREGNDFPTSISYQHTGPNSMEATLKGEKEGQPTTLTISYTKVD